MMYFDNTMRPLEFMRPAGAQYDAALAERSRHDFATRADILSYVLILTCIDQNPCAHFLRPMDIIFQG